MPTARLVLAWFCAYTSAAGVEPTKTAVSCTARPCRANCSTRSRTACRTRTAWAAPSMIFAAMGGLWRQGDKETRRQGDLPIFFLVPLSPCHLVSCPALRIMPDMKIYTRTGDDGTTGLFGGGRVRKCDPRLDCYGTVDELNAAIGLAAVVAPPELRDKLMAIQNELFIIGAHLATPAPGKAAAALPAL